MEDVPQSRIKQVCVCGKGIESHNIALAECDNDRYGVYLKHLDGERLIFLIRI